MFFSKIVVTVGLLFFVCGAENASTLDFRSFRVESVTGTVEFSRRGLGKWKNLRTGIKLRARDKIRTGRQASVDMLLENGTKISLGENTHLSLAKLSGKMGVDDSTSLQMEEGSLLFQVKKLTGSKSSFSFETITATAAIRGTTGGLESTRENTFAWLDEGRLDFRDRATGKLQELRDREFVQQNLQGFRLQKFRDKKSLKQLRKKGRENFRREGFRIPKIFDRKKDLPKKEKNEQLLKNLRQKVGNTSAEKREEIRKQIVEKVKSGEISREQAEEIIRRVSP